MPPQAKGQPSLASFFKSPATVTKDNGGADRRLSEAPTPSNLDNGGGMMSPPPSSAAAAAATAKPSAVAQEMDGAGGSNSSGGGGSASSPSPAPPQQQDSGAVEEGSPSHMTPAPKKVRVWTRGQKEEEEGVNGFLPNEWGSC
jgi:hypothetical protein